MIGIARQKKLNLCAFCHGGGDVFHYADIVRQINFADGTPFGVKVEQHDI